MNEKKSTTLVSLPMWIWASNSMVSIMFKSPLGTFESVLFYGRSVVIWISIVLEKYTLSHCWCQHYSFKGLVPACVVGHMRILGGIRIWKSIWTPWGPNRKEKRQTILFWLYVQFKAPLKFPFLNVDRSLLHIVGSRCTLQNLSIIYNSVQNRLFRKVIT